MHYYYNSQAAGDLCVIAGLSMARKKRVAGRGMQANYARRLIMHAGKISSLECETPVSFVILQLADLK